MQVGKQFAQCRTVPGMDLRYVSAGQETDDARRFAVQFAQKTPVVVGERRRTRYAMTG